MTDQTDLTDAEYAALAAFRHRLRRFHAFSEDAARQAGLTPSHHQLLLAIRAHADGSPSVSDVAEALVVKLHSATELVDRAVAKGLVTKEHDDPSDARRAVLALTEEGSRSLTDLSRLHRSEVRVLRDELAEVLGGLG